MSLRPLLPSAVLATFLVASCGGGNTTDDAATATTAAATTEAASGVATTDPPATQPSSSIPPATTLSVTTDGDCAFAYNETTLAERAWAFDGTLVDVGAVEDSRLGSTPSATFAVNRWYRGGTGEQVTVQYEMAMGDETAPPAGLGARLLVAGEARWDGAPLDDPVAWGCGFTQTWSAKAAQTWKNVFNG